jgi:uncharacterized protein
MPKARAHRVAVVTGAGSGIGRGIALALARRHVDLALVGRRADKLEETAREARVRGVRALPFAADLSDPADRAALLARVREALGPLSILVNNAAVMMAGDFAGLTASQIERAVATNLLAPAELTRQALPDLIANRGSVVLVASGVSYVPLPYAALYSATKAGVRGLGEALRVELEPLGVHLLIAYPPATDTAMVKGIIGGAGLSGFPLASPERVGERIVRAMVRRQPTVHVSRFDYVYGVLYMLAPWLVQAAYRSQRKRLAAMMAAASREE